MRMVLRMKRAMLLRVQSLVMVATVTAKKTSLQAGMPENMKLTAIWWLVSMLVSPYDAAIFCVWVIWNFLTLLLYHSSDPKEQERDRKILSSGRADAEDSDDTDSDTEDAEPVSKVAAKTSAKAAPAKADDNDEEDEEEEDQKDKEEDREYFDISKFTFYDGPKEINGKPKNMLL